jgi:hypothetical protein
MPRKQKRTQEADPAGRAEIQLVTTNGAKLAVVWAAQRSGRNISQYLHEWSISEAIAEYERNMKAAA